MGLCCQFLYDLVLHSGQACHSTILSIDIKTFDNLVEEEENRQRPRYAVPTNYAAWDASVI